MSKKKSNFNFSKKIHKKCFFLNTFIILCYNISSEPVLSILRDFFTS